MSIPSRSLLAPAAVLIVIIGGVVALLWPTPSSSPAPSSGPAPSDGPTSPDPARPTVLFIGDSYTLGSSSAEMSPSCQAARALGWYCDLAAQAGTGYISGGPANRFTLDEYSGESRSFEERIPGLGLRYQPDIVVLDGGRNDLFPPTRDVYRAMVATIADVRRTWPEATVIVERPRFLDRPGDDLGFDDAFFARLLAEPVAQDVTMIDPIAQFAGTDTSDLLGDDGIHPNHQGQQRLAEVLTDALSDDVSARAS